MCAAAVPDGLPDGLVVEPRTTLNNPHAQDQDDMCIWVDRSDPSRSTVIASDKTAGKLFVYDLSGGLVQRVDVEGKPGNIDLRYDFPLAGEKVDIVAFNERDHSAIHVYRVDRETRLLVRIDDERIATGPNYGFTLYLDRTSGKFYGFTVADEDGHGVEQYELAEDGKGRVKGRKVRAWEHPKSEGCVADDLTGALYVGTEEVGVWKFNAAPEQTPGGKLIVAVGDNGLVADVEGVTLLTDVSGDGYLVVSSQGSGEFKVYARKPPHAFIHSFSVRGASDTDGIDLVNVALTPAFPQGLFALHNGATTPCPILLCDLRDLGLLGPRGNGD
ncbi:MAG: phytase [Candidatus Hydrogenedentales bacterium]